MEGPTCFQNECQSFHAVQHCDIGGGGTDVESLKCHPKVFRDYTLSVDKDRGSSVKRGLRQKKNWLAISPLKDFHHNGRNIILLLVGLELPNLIAEGLKNFRGR